jgi:hypothetical protein
MVNFYGRLIPYFYNTVLLLNAFKEDGVKFVRRGNQKVTFNKPTAVSFSTLRLA